MQDVMKTVDELKTGDILTNQLGELLTVLEVIGSTMIRVYEDYNNLYHHTKLFINGCHIQK